MTNKQLTREQFGITSEKMFNFALYMFSPNSETYDNGTKSAGKAGYKGKDNYLARVASENVRKCKIIAVKDALQAKAREKVEMSRDMLIDNMRSIVLEGDKDSDKIKAGSLIADMCGWKREAGPNPEKEALRAKKTETETKLLMSFAEHQTEKRAKQVESEVIDV